MSSVVDFAWYKIFTGGYKIQIKRAFTIDPNEAYIYGLPTTGDKNFDKDLANTDIVVFATIDQMVEYLDEGIPFTPILNQAEFVEIYNICLEHIADSCTFLEYNRSFYYETDETKRLNAILLDDLVKIYNFVLAVGERIRGMYTETIDPRLASFMQASSAGGSTFKIPVTTLAPKGSYEGDPTLKERIDRLIQKRMRYEHY